MQAGIVAEQVKIDELLGARSQDDLPGIPTLHNVVRNIDGVTRGRRATGNKVTENVPSVPGFQLQKSKSWVSGLSLYQR